MWCNYFHGSSKMHQKLTTVSNVPCDRVVRLKGVTLIAMLYFQKLVLLGPLPHPMLKQRLFSCCHITAAQTLLLSQLLISAQNLPRAKSSLTCTKSDADSELGRVKLVDRAISWAALATATMLVTCWWLKKWHVPWNKFVAKCSSTVSPCSKQSQAPIHTFLSPANHENAGKNKNVSYHPAIHENAARSLPLCPVSLKVA